MNIPVSRIAIFSLLFSFLSCKAPGGNDNTSVLIKTTVGEIKIKLYDDTPIHRDNFIKMVNSGVYENVLFHRVIKDFMIQTGDPSTSINKKNGIDSLSNYTIKAEFNPLHYHKKGALAAARRGNEDNPDMRSSGTQFYIVQGVKLSDSELDQAELKINNNIKQSVFNRIIRHTADSLRSLGKNPSDGEIQESASEKIFNSLSSLKAYKIPTDQREVYKTLGGVPRLDCTYTVFGEVTEGLDIVDRIAKTPTDANDKPVEDIRIIRIKILKE
jgi:peptidylprolyl isomerase